VRRLMEREEVDHPGYFILTISSFRYSLRLSLFNNSIVAS